MRHLQCSNRETLGTNRYRAMTRRAEKPNTIKGFTLITLLHARGRWWLAPSAIICAVRVLRAVTKHHCRRAIFGPIVLAKHPKYMQQNRAQHQFTAKHVPGGSDIAQGSVHFKIWIYTRDHKAFKTKITKTRAAKNLHVEAREQHQNDPNQQ